MKRFFALITVCLVIVLSACSNKVTDTIQESDSYAAASSESIGENSVQYSVDDKKDEEIVNSTNYGNIRFNGIVAQKDDWIYYSNEDDNGNLYRKNVKEGIEEKLNDTDSDYINIYGQTIFYRQAENHNISKMELDGSGDCVVYDGFINDLICFDGKLYFVEGSEDGRQALIELNPDSKSKKVLYTGYVQWPVIAGDQIYFSSYEGGEEEGLLFGNLVCLDYNTREIRLVCKGGILCPIIEGKNIYYAEEKNRRICCVDVSDDSEKKCIYEFPRMEEKIIKEGDYIYYADYNDLYRISIENGEEEVILSMEGDICWFGVVKNAIYVGYSTKEGLKTFWKILE